MTKRKKIFYEKGQKFNRLTLIEFSHRDEKHRQMWVCSCECGNSKTFQADRVKRGAVKSCGCFEIENRNKQSEMFKTHLKVLAKQKSDHVTEETTILAMAKIVYCRYKECDISFDEFLSLSQMNCFYCNSAPNNKAHAGYTKDGKPKAREIWNNPPAYLKFPNAWFVYNGLDRLDNTKRHSKDNVVPCCFSCNEIKSSSSLNEFLLKIKSIYENVNLSKTLPTIEDCLSIVEANKSKNKEKKETEETPIAYIDLYA